MIQYYPEYYSLFQRGPALPGIEREEIQLLREIEILCYIKNIGV